VKARVAAKRRWFTPRRRVHILLRDIVSSDEWAAENKAWGEAFEAALDQIDAFPRALRQAREQVARDLYEQFVQPIVRTGLHFHGSAAASLGGQALRPNELLKPGYLGTAGVDPTS